MTKAKVYFSDMRTRYGGLSLPQKLGKLIEAAGIGDIDFQNKFAAIKIHFGEPGNLSFSANRAIFLFCAQIMPK